MTTPTEPAHLRAADALAQAALHGGHAGATRATEATHGETPTEPTNGPHTRVQLREQVYALLNADGAFTGCPSTTTDQIMQLITREPARCADCDCFDPDTCPYRSPAQAADHIRATVTSPDGHHHYLSTYCVHHDCGQCRRTCKHCGTPCLCRCHSHDEPADTQQEQLRSAVKGERP